MPYKAEKIKLPKEYDRRRKLTDEQKEEIKHKYETGLYSQRALAAEYGVSRRLITFVLDENKAQRAAEQLKERKKDGRYSYTKEERNAIAREHRAYKHTLYVQGKIKEESEENLDGK